jgi:predicted short-subunit dehydrogenase-like oxidoreductase (DUF2520 family)
MDTAIIGAGRVGTAIGVLLGRAGHRILGVSGRAPSAERAARWLPGVPVGDPATVAHDAELIVLAIPDDLLRPTATSLAAEGVLTRGRWVLHVSGAVGLDVLEAARIAGAGRLALHPLQTFPDVDAAIQRIPGSRAAVTADDAGGLALGSRLARDLGAVPFPLSDGRRPLYHAAAVFASNHLVALASVAERLFDATGVPEPADAVVALQETTLDNVARLGPGRALTGPAVRGDGGTILKNLEALGAEAPELVGPYVAMTRLALSLAEESGRLEPSARTDVDEVLSRWS